MLSRLSRVTGSPWVRAGLAAAVVAFCAYGLVRDWPEVLAGLRRLHWYSVTCSLAAAMAGAACMMLAWRAVLADLGSRLPVRCAARVSFLSQLAKYVPGGVWAVATQVELGRRYGVPRPRSLAAVGTALIVTVGSGLALAGATLPLASPAVARQYWWVLAAVPVIAVVLCPPVLGRVLDRAFALLRCDAAHTRPTWAGLGRAVGWSLAGWLLLGLQVWLLVADMTGSRHGTLLLAVGGYALAFCAGTLLVVAPSGLGAREIILIAALSQALPYSTAVAVALVTRLVTTGCDMAWAAVGLAAGRSRVAAVSAARDGGDHVQAGPASALILSHPSNSGPADERRGCELPGNITY